MKKNLFLLLVCMGCVSVSFAQMKVDNAGNVGIGLPSYPPNVVPLSKLTVGNAGDANAMASIYAGQMDYALKVQSGGSKPTLTSIYSTVSSAGNQSYKAIALHGVGGSNNAPYPVGMGIGARGVALKNGYGVSGLIDGTNGVGVYGGTGNTEVAISGRYAGYFNGDVHITTKLKVNTIDYPSDYRYKQNVEGLNGKKTFASVLSLNPVEYNFKQRYLDAVDSLGNPIKVEYFDEKSELFQKKHYGLIAQEVREIYPDLVYEDGDGYLSIDYISIIPLLIQSIKEQNTRIKQLEMNNVYTNSPVLKSSTNTTGEETVLSITSAVLYQNTPNPFNQSTEIRYYIPENSQSAQLCIYNLQGNQIKRIVVAERGENSYLLSASELTAGMYLYTLIIDGKEIDTKRMILTE